MDAMAAIALFPVKYWTNHCYLCLDLLLFEFEVEVQLQVEVLIVFWTWTLFQTSTWTSDCKTFVETHALEYGDVYYSSGSVTGCVKDSIEVEYEIKVEI